MGEEGSTAVTHEERLRETGGLLNLEKRRLKRNLFVLQISGRCRGDRSRHFWQGHTEQNAGSGH